MAAIGTLTLLSPSLSQGFFVMNFSDGWYKPTKFNRFEELDAYGSAAIRLRITGTGYKKFSLTGFADFLTFADAVTAAQNATKWIGGVCTIALTAAGQSSTATDKYYVLDANGSPLSAIAVGANLLTADPKAIVRFDYTLLSTGVSAT